MKILSAKVSEPNTPETDLMECVSHDVRVSFHILDEYYEAKVMVLARDPQDAIRIVQNMANEKTVLSLWPPKPSQSEIESNAVALHQSENPEDYEGHEGQDRKFYSDDQDRENYTHPFNPKPAYTEPK